MVHTINIKNIFKVHLSFIILLSIILFSGNFLIYLKILGLLIIHEIGHLLIITIYKINIYKIHLSGIGIFIDVDLNIKEEVKYLLFSMGLVFSILLQIILVIINNKLLINFNTFLILINLIPVYPLDGFQLLNTILSHFYEDEYRINLIKKIGFLILGLLLIIFISFRLWYILLLFIFLTTNLFKYINKYKSYSYNYYTLLFKANK